MGFIKTFSFKSLIPFDLNYPPSSPFAPSFHPFLLAGPSLHQQSHSTFTPNTDRNRYHFSESGLFPFIWPSSDASFPADEVFVIE